MDWSVLLLVFVVVGFIRLAYLWYKTRKRYKSKR